MSDSPITEAVLASLADARSPRLREVGEALVRHLHAFAAEVGLTQAEWAAGIAFLTRTGQTCTPSRQEFILLSDVLGLSMLVDEINHRFGGGATESTVVGPFYRPDPPGYPLGADRSISDTLLAYGAAHIAPQVRRAQLHEYLRVPGVHEAHLVEVAHRPVCRRVEAARR